MTTLLVIGLVLLLVAIQMARVQLRKQRRVDYMRENQAIWEQTRMLRFKRWIRSMEYTGPETLEPRWRYYPDPHDQNFECY